MGGNSEKDNTIACSALQYNNTVVKEARNYDVIDITMIKIKID